MQVELYAFEDENGELDTYTTFNVNEAREYAKQNKRKLIAQIFEYSDSELVEDYTESEQEEGDELCDLCNMAGVTVSRTTPCGKTIGIECGCDESRDDCGNPDCEECNP